MTNSATAHLAPRVSARAPRARVARRVTVATSWERTAYGDLVARGTVRHDGVRVSSPILSVVVDTRTGTMFPCNF